MIGAHARAYERERINIGFKLNIFNEFSEVTMVEVGSEVHLLQHTAWVQFPPQVKFGPLYGHFCIAR